MKNQKFLPWVIPEQCEGCAECVHQCPKGCLFMKETSNPEIFVPWIENIDACSGCGKCQNSCIWLAISMTTYIEQARDRFMFQEI